MHRRFGLLMLMLISILAHAGDEDARARLHQATMNPEYMLDHWISLPLSPDASQSKVVKMSLNDAILLALRYNPNIQNSELDNIINRYQLRIAYNEFELQYALASGDKVALKPLLPVMVMTAWLTSLTPATVN